MEGKRPPARPPELTAAELLPPPPSKPNPWVEAKRAQATERERRRVNRKRGRPEAERARKAVAHAIERGELVPLPCEYRFDGCLGSPTEAHHLSYDKGRELDVKWACKPCHDTLTTKIMRKRKAGAH
jgi:hypothetical protein